MATVDTLPIRQIAETGDYVVGKDGSANEEARFAVGTAASLNAGPALTQTLRGDDLENGLATRIGALRKIFRSYDFDGGADIIRILPTGASNQAVSVSFYGVNISSNRATGQINVRLGKDATGVEGSFDAYYRGLQSAKLVTFTHEGQSWVGLQVVGNLGGTGMNEGCFYGAATSAFDPALVVSVYAADVTNLLPFNGGSQVASGRGGDAIGNFSPLRNTAIADMSVATDFQVLEKQTWTPRLEGVVVAGSPTYVRQDGFLWRYGKLCYGTFDVEISAKDPAASGPLLVRGTPTIADTAIVEHMATIHRFNNVAAPAGVIQYAPHYVPQGGLHAIRIHLVTDNAAGSFLDASALTDTTRIHGAFKFTVA